MSQGTLYTTPQVRGILAKALVKYYDLDIAIEASKEDPKYVANFPLKKIPAFIGAKGVKLHEVIAILIYLINLGEENSKFLGKNYTEFALILKWASLSTAEYMPVFSAGFKPLIGAAPYNKKVVETNLAAAEVIAEVFESRLSEFTYLVGERITLADLFCASMFSRGFEFIYGVAWRKSHPAITRWFKTVTASPVLKDFYVDYQFREKPVEYVPPKKEKKEQAPKAEKPKAAPKAKEVEEEDDTPREEKPKHPLELLGKSKLPLDEWKRVYSNQETREEAVPWFWEHFDASEWSIYKVDYKYNDELTLTFMSNNLVGGFFNRLSASTKYMFGCMVVYGENNNNGITGAFMIRGQDYVPAFDVAPDWESYEFTKLDSTTEETKKFVNNMWAWDEPVEVNGEKKEIADGKVFK